MYYRSKTDKSKGILNIRIAAPTAVWMSTSKYIHHKNMLSEKIMEQHIQYMTLFTHTFKQAKQTADYLGAIHGH